jgi:hypothetical protein
VVPDAQGWTEPDSPRGAGAPATDAAGEQPGHEVAGALHGRTGACLIVGAAASRVDVRMAELPGLLYRISTPADSGLAPRVTGPAGRVRVGLRPTGADGRDSVVIVLNRTVRWDIRLPAGAGEQRLDLARGRLARLDVGAAGLVDLRLPRPAGTVPVILPDGAGSMAVTAPRSTPVRVRLRRGAGTVTISWAAGNEDRSGAERSGAARADGVRAGGVLTAPGWSGAVDRYAVDIRARLDRLTVR